MTSAWPFKDLPTGPSNTSRFVLDKDYPILVVSHDPDSY
jgi:hypothetical protein